MGDVCEELLLGTLVIVTLPYKKNTSVSTLEWIWGAKRTLELHTQAVGHGLDALGPDGLVELGIQADVGGAHRLLRKVNHRLNGPGGALLERAAVHALVQVDGVLAGDDVLERGAGLAAGLLMKMGRLAHSPDSITGVGVDLGFCCGGLRVGSDGERRAEEQRNDVPCLADVGVDEQRGRGLALIWLGLLCKQSKVQWLASSPGNVRAACCRCTGAVMAPGVQTRVQWA